MRSPLPAPTDHAFADGGTWPASPGRPRWTERLLGRVASALVEAHQARLARAAADQFSQGALLGAGVQISHTARLVNRGRREAVRIGAHSVVRGIVRNEPSGSIAIGAEVYVGDGTLISAAESVTIGDQTLLAHGVQIFDNASHPFDADQRAEHFRMMLGLAPKRPVRIPSNPVSIGRNCWICTNAIILPGSRIGDRAIVSAGSVVKGDVPPDVVYGAAAAAGGEPVLTRREPVGRP